MNLHEAAEAGNSELIQATLLRGTTPVDVRDGDGATPLLLAAFKGHVDAARCLIQWGAQIDAANERGYTPLMAAARDGRIEAVRLLLQHGASVDRVDAEGLTPLIFAAGYSLDPSVLQELLRAGAGLDVQQPSGATAIMWAASMGLEKNVRVLLEHGADPKRRDSRGRSAFSEARRRNRTAVVALLGEWKQQH